MNKRRQQEERAFRFEHEYALHKLKETLEREREQQGQQERRPVQIPVEPDEGADQVTRLLEVIADSRAFVEKMK